ncbi:MAG: hypothetical protein D6686_06415 [Alphaproteobacteria bacterium]|nr:MAG: hypothetical protein D6686_06415 [Alphaproteobacteria bacterium]
MLEGSWRLLSWEIRQEGRSRHPFGPDATGLLVYAADGGMSAVIARAGRAPLSAAVPRQAPAAERLAAFDSYFHYAGTWRTERRGDAIVVIHRVTHSLNPALVGTEQLRHVDLDGDRLTLRAEEGPRLHRLSWARAW